MGNAQTSKSIAEQYKIRYNEELEYKDVFYFKALIEEVKKDKEYDRIVISEELEQFPVNSLEEIDKFIFNNIDKVTDEVEASVSKIIFICSDRRTRSDGLLNKLYGNGIYSMLIGDDRSISNLCSIINTPKTKKQAKEFLGIDYNTSITSDGESEDTVEEDQIFSILKYYERLGNDSSKYVETFDEIAEQNTQKQLKVIANFLPQRVKDVLMASDKYAYLYIGLPDRSEEKSKPQEKKNLLSILKWNKAEREEEEARKREERRIRQEEERLEEEEKERQKEEELKRRREAEEAKRQAEEKRLREESERKRLAEEKKKQEELERKKIEEARRAEEAERDRKQEEERRAAEERRRQEALEREARRREEEKQRDEAEIVVENLVAPQIESVKNNKQEAETIKQAEEEKARQEAEARSQAEEERARQETEARRQAEEERARQETEARRQAEEERARQEAEDRRQAEEERARQEAEARRQAEEERARQEAEARRQAEEERARQEAEARRQAEEERARQEAEARRQAEEERARQEAEARRQAEEERARQEAESPAKVEDEQYSNYRGGIYEVPKDYKKVVVLVGANKSGTTFLVNAISNNMAAKQVNTAILDMTKDRGVYYIYNRDEQKLRRIALECLKKLSEGVDTFIPADKFLRVYTAVPGTLEENRKNLKHKMLLETVKRNNNLVIVDADFSTPVEYFEQASEIYIVQDLDILKLQETTMFLRELKNRQIDMSKIKIIINKYVKTALTPKKIVEGLSYYNDPEMSFVDELLNGKVIYSIIPYRMENYANYVEGLYRNNINYKMYTQDFKDAIESLCMQIYPVGRTAPVQKMRRGLFG